LIEQESKNAKRPPKKVTQKDDFQFAMGLVEEDIRRATLEAPSNRNTHEPSDTSKVHPSAPTHPLTGDPPSLEKTESEDLAARLM